MTPAALGLHGRRPRLPAAPSTASRVERAVLAAARAVLRLTGSPVVVRGTDNVPGSGPVVVASNHASYLDPVLLGVALSAASRVPRHLAKRELFNAPVLGAVLRHVSQIPVDRTAHPGAALRDAAAALGAGELLVVFPEGTIRPYYSPSGLKTGAARLAMTVDGVVLVPAALVGARTVQTRMLTGRLRAGGARAVALEVRFGAPLGVVPGETPRALTRRLAAAIDELLGKRRRPGR